jgi:hypothetical protein
MIRTVSPGRTGGGSSTGTHDRRAGCVAHADRPRRTGTSVGHFSQIAAHRPTNAALLPDPRGILWDSSPIRRGPRRILKHLNLKHPRQCRLASCRLASCHLASCHLASCHSRLCHSGSCYPRPRHPRSCYPRPCHPRPCHPRPGWSAMEGRRRVFPRTRFFSTAQPGMALFAGSVAITVTALAGASRPVLEGKADGARN